MSQHFPIPKIKDPRDDYKGKRNVKIIRDFLNINTPLKNAESIISSFFSKNKLSNLSIKNYLKKISTIDKDIGKKYSIKITSIIKIISFMNDL